MDKMFIVTDELGERSRNVSNDELDEFKRFKKANKRAKELAGYSPGDEILIFQLVAKVKAPVGKPKSKRL